MTSTDLGQGWTAIRNSDFSGDVELIDTTSPIDRFRVPFECLLNLVAEYKRQCLISDTEQTDARTLLGITKELQ